jgi:hypothetical protein
MADSTEFDLMPPHSWRNIAGAKVGYRKMQDREAEFARRWQGRRTLLWWSIGIYGVLIAFVFGPMYFLRGVDYGPKSPGDFVADVQRYCVPVVRKMKEYERLHGKRPDDIRTFAPEFCQTQEGQVALTAGTYTYFAEYHHVIRYDFTPGNEHWTVKGPFVTGTIPAPPVELEPATRPVPIQ